MGPDLSTTSQVDAPQPPVEIPSADEGSDFKKLMRRLGPAGPLAIINATLPLLGSLLLFTSLNAAGPWLRGHGDLGVVVYVVGFALLTGFSLLSNNAPTTLGGWAFGFAVGLPTAMLGMILGAWIGYGVARAASGGRVVGLIDEQPKWRAVCRELIGSGLARTILLIALLRLCSPFAVANFVLAAVRVPIWTYTLGTIAGLLPRAVIIVYGASHASQLDLRQSGARWMLAAGVVVIVILVTIISRMAKRALERFSIESAIDPSIAEPTPPGR